MLKIDFVSDIACPWCAVGFASLQQALSKLGAEVPVQLQVQPFEINPRMAAEGEDTVEHLMRKYGITPERVAQSREQLQQRGAEAGFTFGARSRIWNTFDAHRLLHWAGLQGRQVALKAALLAAYHTHDRNPSDPEVLAAAAAEAGLDTAQAREVLASGAYADEVRALEQQWQEAGIEAVPSFVINDQYLIQGAQTAEVLEEALREIAQAAQGEEGEAPGA